MSSFLGDMTLKIGAAIVAMGVLADPSQCFFGREGFTREIESGPVVQVLHDPAGDAYDYQSARQGAASRFRRWTGVVVNFWGSSSKSGATTEDHIEALDGLVDAFALKLVEQAHKLTFEVRNLVGRVVLEDETNPDADMFGARYEMRFQLSRGVNETAAAQAAANLVTKQVIVVVGQDGGVLASGAAASIPALAGGLATLAGLAGITSDMVGQAVVVSGAASSPNNGTFRVVAFVDATSVQIANPSAVVPDAKNGSIAWSLNRAEVDVPGV